MNSEPPDGQGVWHYDETVNICNTYIFFSFFLFFFYVHISMPITYLPLDTPLSLLVFLCVYDFFFYVICLLVAFVQLVCVAIVFFGSYVLLACSWAG